MNLQKAVLLETGDLLYYLGEKRPLRVMREERKTGRVKSVMGRILMWIPYEADYAFKRELLEKWYRKEAAEVLGEKAEFYGKLLNVSFHTIRIKDQKSRWGSCSGKGNLNFNWRLMLAPEAVCDYVVIHELCHLVHMDHSERFWRLVAELCPAYQEYRKWLRENGGWMQEFIAL